MGSKPQIAMNPEMTRAVVKAPFGFACYECTVDSERITGRHRGVVGTVEEADAWLAGQTPANIIRVYPEAASGQ